MTPLLHRIIEAAKGTDVFNLLAKKLAPTDLQSLMLEVYRHRSMTRKPADLLNDYRQNRFFGSAPFEESDLAEWNEIARRIGTPQFEFLTLSPVSPLGTCATLAGVSQNWSIPTARTGEVSSDPTNVLALEAAIRREEVLKRDATNISPIHLSTTQRVVRPQHYASPNASAHFSLFCLFSSGRDRGSFGFEKDALTAHLAIYLASFRSFFGDDFMLRISYTISNAGRPDARVEAIRNVARHYGVILEEDPIRVAVKNYYSGFCFHIWGGWLLDGMRQLADGGTVDWTAKLLSNAKERALISGTGVDGLISLRKLK